MQHLIHVLYLELTITYVFQNLMKNSLGPNVYSFRRISNVNIDRKNQSALSRSNPMNQALINIIKSKKYLNALK